MHVIPMPLRVPRRSSPNCLEVTLRPYRSGDLEGMTALDKVCFSGAFVFGETMMEVLAEAAQALTLIAEGPSSEMAGFIIAHSRQEERPDAAYLVTVDVQPSLRRCGIGHGLLRAVERVLAEASVNCLELHVHTGNADAIRFYEHQGYKRQGRIPHFYAGSLDAFLYSKQLAAPVAVTSTPAD